MHNLLEHITDREIDDEVGRTIDDDEEVTDTDKNRDPDGTLSAATGVKVGYLWVEDIFTEIQSQPAIRK